MNNLLKKHQKAMKGNAGFSLVELIIVIAIMVALVAVLAPQYIRYVENSRNAALQTAANEGVTILRAEAALGNIKLATGQTSATVTYSNGKIEISDNLAYDTTNGYEKDDLMEALGGPTVGENNATATYIITLKGESGGAISEVSNPVLEPTPTPPAGGGEGGSGGGTT